MTGNAKIQDALYYFKDGSLDDKPALGLSCNVGSLPVKKQIMIWYFRLEHSSFAYLKHLFPTLFQKLPYQNFQYDVCCFSKSQ